MSRSIWSERARGALTLLCAPMTCVLLVAATSVLHDDRSPIFGVSIPPGFRQWQLIALSHEAGSLNELRAILGNDIAVKAFRAGTLPFPDGAIIAKVAWKQVPSAQDDAALGQAQAFVPGAPTTRQFMVKESRRYASTGGWGFGRFIDGKPVDEAQHRTCAPCHQAFANQHDMVFTHFAP
jgi:Cytochrome P460